MNKPSSYHIYVTEKDVIANTSKYFHHNHYITDRFLHEHGVKIMDIKALRYYQVKNNLSGGFAVEVTIDAKFVDPVADRIRHAAGDKIQE